MDPSAWRPMKMDRRMELQIPISLTSTSVMRIKWYATLVHRFLLLTSGIKIKKKKKKIFNFFKLKIFFFFKYILNFKFFFFFIGNLWLPSFDWSLDCHVVFDIDDGWHIAHGFPLVSRVASQVYLRALFTGNGPASSHCGN